MRNGFGLKLLHKFFNLPFLQLQRETLLKQLETNEEETRLTIQELDLFQNSDDADYNKFLDNLVNRRRALADSVSASNSLVPGVVPSSASSHHLTATSSTSGGSVSAVGEVRRSASMPGQIGGGTPIPVKSLELRSSLSARKESSAMTSASDNSSSSSSAKAAQNIVTQPVAQNVVLRTEAAKIAVESASDNGERRDSIKQSQSQSLMSKFFGHKKEDDADVKLPHIKNFSSNAPLTSVEDFVPDDGMLDRSFLEDNSQVSPQKMQQEEVDSER